MGQFTEISLVLDDNTAFYAVCSLDNLPECWLIFLSNSRQNVNIKTPASGTNQIGFHLGSFRFEFRVQNNEREIIKCKRSGFLF